MQMSFEIYGYQLWWGWTSLFSHCDKGSDVAIIQPDICEAVLFLQRHWHFVLNHDAVLAGFWPSEHQSGA